MSFYKITEHDYKVLLLLRWEIIAELPIQVTKAPF